MWELVRRLYYKSSLLASWGAYSEGVVAAETEIVDLQVLLSEVIYDDGISLVCGDTFNVVTTTELAITATTH